MQHWSDPRPDPLSIVSPVDAIAEIDRELRFIADEKKRRSLNRIESFFQDSGPFRRELYPRHCEFMKAGRYYRSRLFSAGNRCILPWTPLETDRGERLASEVLGETGFGVRSWDGRSRCTKPASALFLRGIERAFLLLTDTGQAFPCSHRHQVLTSEGWTEVSRLVHRASGLRCWRNDGDLRASYGSGDHRDDAQPLSPRDACRASIPSQEYAQIQHLFRGERAGAWAPKSPRNHAFRAAGRHSNLDGQSQIGVLCDRFEDSYAYSLSQWPTRLRQDALQFARELVPHPQDASSRAGQSCARQFSETEFQNDCSTRLGRDNSYRTLRLSDRLSGLLTSGEEFLLGALQTAIFVPFVPLLLAGNTSIVALIDLGYQPIIDFEVQDTHCYESQGVISHNCGKTITGAFEMATHLTGLYPPWWEGRVFEETGTYWAAGTSNETTKNIVQAELLGKLEKDTSISDDVIGMGTGMIPSHLIAAVEFHAQIRGAIKTAWVRHVSGKRNSLNFKSFEQSSTAFEGQSVLLSWLDESPPLDVYTETLMRSLTTEGGVMITATPLVGLTDLVMQFMPDGVVPEWETCKACGKQLMAIDHLCPIAA